MMKLFGSLMVTRFRGPFFWYQTHHDLRGDPFPSQDPFAKPRKPKSPKLDLKEARIGRSKVFSRRNQRHVGSGFFWGP